MHGDERGSSGLPSPAVAPSEYDSDYYLHSCLGADEWRESGGAQTAGMYPGALRLAGLEPGERVLDIGTGRGDLLPVAIEMGAAEAVGIDYSPAAIELASQTLAAAGQPGGAMALLSDARRIPVEDGGYDLATMLDVVEHLSPEELAVSLAEATRALRPGGRIFVHTAPNALVYNVTYRVQRRLTRRRARHWPTEPRNDLERRMHVNEQTPRSLRRVLRDAGFREVRVELGRWVHTDFVPDERAKVLYHRLARVPIAKHLGVIDMFGYGVKPLGG